MRTLGPLVAILSFLVASVAAQAPPAPPSRAPDKADAVLAATRDALGGEARIAGVKTFTASGRTRQVRGENLIPIEFEIQAELPDRFSRRDEFPAQDNGPATTGFNGDALIQIPPAPQPPARAGVPPPTPEQLAGARGARVAAAKQDFARLMLGMFATSTSSFPLTFAYVAQAEAPQGKADVVDVIGPANFRARLFIDAQTHLPIMLTWQAPVPPGPRGGGPPPQVEQRLYFADYRAADGFQLPHRLRRAVGADTTEETTFDRFRINTRTDPRRFETGN